jgi:hypothetical protein
LSWNQIYELRQEPPARTVIIFNIPSEVIAEYDADWGAELFGRQSSQIGFG